MELSDSLVSGSHRTLALEDVNLYRRLVVRCRREYLALAGRDGGVGLDQLGEHSAVGLDTEAQRSNVEQKHVLYVACQNAALDRCADSHNLIWVNALVRLLSEEVLNQLLNPRDTGGTSYKQYLVDVACAQVSV